MNSANTSGPKLGLTQWLVIIVASIGFLFDTYELLMTPLVAVPAIAELLSLPPNNPNVTAWTGRLLWISALCGGVFGLLGGWLIDRFGRKTVMAASIFMYAFSPVAAAFSTSLEMFVFFRSTTFIGVCVEFVAAITWLAELFPDKHQREKVLGWTQAFASLGGLLVTGINAWILANASSLPAIHGGHASWRYTLITGLLPAIPIALMLPFVPESQVWREKRLSGALKRPSFGALFSPELRRVTLVTAALSACAYAAAFGALQMTPLRISPGLPELGEQRKALKPLSDEANALNVELLKSEPGSAERKAIGGRLKANREKAAPYDKVVKEKGNAAQFYQEMGGLLGRIALAVMLALAMARAKLLRMFILPGLAIFPLTYFMLYKSGGDAFMWGVFFCGFMVVGQFSYFGEYLPKVFPLHLRGTGGSFATNVGGRMLGTSAAFLTTNILAPMMSGQSTFDKVAMAAGIVGTSVFALALVFSFLLPEPKSEGAD